MLPRDDAYENTYNEKHEMDETRGAGRRQKMARIIEFSGHRRLTGAPRPASRRRRVSFYQ